jgi:electron transfer flavoprotein beta subunit
VHLSDEALAGSDAAATSLALAGAIRHLEADGPADLILAGMASTDGETSLVPAQLAERLDRPQVTFASTLELDGRRLTARRDGGSHADTIEAPLPALVSVTDQINSPRYPNFKGIMAAKKKTITTLSLADIGVDASQVGRAGSWTAVETAEARPPRTAGTIITDEGDAGIQLVEFLAAQKLL